MRLLSSSEKDIEFISFHFFGSQHLKKLILCFCFPSYFLFCLFLMDDRGCFFFLFSFFNYSFYLILFSLWCTCVAYYLITDTSKMGRELLQSNYNPSDDIWD